MTHLSVEIIIVTRVKVYSINLEYVYMWGPRQKFQWIDQLWTRNFDQTKVISSHGQFMLLAFCMFTEISSLSVIAEIQVLPWL